MRYLTSSSLVFLLVLCGAAGWVHAQEQPPTQPSPPEKAEKEEGGLPSVDEAVEGMERVEGLLPLYRKKETLYALIPSGQLDKPMLLATSIAGGSQLTGFQWSDMMVKFVRHEDKVLLIRPETRYGTRKKEDISTAVERTHPGYLVAALPIKGADSNKGVVIDLSELYTKNADAFIGSMAKGRVASLARLAKVKGFPQNVEVAVDLPATPKGMDHGDILTVHYSLSSLPETSYVPRLADGRIGYFLTVAKDYSKDYRADTTYVRYINRWGLEKADPELELSPPKEPIIFYIEKTVPTRYRRYVREGILEWNKAFEKIGFTDAVVVRQQTESQFADLDPEDVRYNFFRWITSDWAFAMGPSRVDPRTGQILDADILFDDAMVRAYMDDWDLLIEEAMIESRSPTMRRYLEEHPEWDPLRLISPHGQTAAKGPLVEAAKLLEGSSQLDGSEPFGAGRSLCSLGRGLSRQMALASLYLSTMAAEDAGEEGGDGDQEEDKEREWPEEFVGQIVKETVLHEVGHTLGLRHNFEASTWRPLDEMHEKDGEKVADLTSSVMDYNPINLAPEGVSQGYYQQVVLGPYDFWAIEYGYTQTGIGDPYKEQKELGKIAARSAEPGHQYGTDEDVYLGDPLINRWDFGADPLDYTRHRVALSQSLKDKVVDRVVQEGSNYDAARRAVNQLFGEIGYTSWLASRFVGGTYFHRDHRGDPNARDPIVVVPAEKQREALSVITDYLFDPETFELAPDVMRKLAPSRWSHWGTWPSVYYTEAAYPFHDRVLAMQTWSLNSLLSPSTLDRILNTEIAAESGDEPLTMPELFSELGGAIFSELDEPARGRAHSNTDPMLNGIRRNLQREYVSRLIDLTLSSERSWYPRAARTLAWYELKKLDDSLESYLSGVGGSLDDYSRAHLEETRERIERALDASFEMRS